MSGVYRKPPKQKEPVIYQSDPAALTEREEKLLHRLAVAGRLISPEDSADVTAGYRLWALKLADKPAHGGRGVVINAAGVARLQELAAKRNGRQPAG